MDLGAEDLTTGRQVGPDDDDDDHDDHDDNDKINDTEGVDPERLKAFNVRREHGVGSDRVQHRVQQPWAWLLANTLCDFILVSASDVK